MKVNLILLAFANHVGLSSAKRYRALRSSLPDLTAPVPSASHSHRRHDNGSKSQSKHAVQRTNNQVQECYGLNFKTDSSWEYAASQGTFEIDGYGQVPKHCHDSLTSECFIRVCGQRVLTVRAKTTDAWRFTIEGEIGPNVARRSVLSTSQGQIPFPATLDTDEFDNMQIYELGTCFDVSFETYTPWPTSASQDRFLIEYHGYLPKECHNTTTAKCDVRLCGTGNMVIKTLTSDYWAFKVSGTGPLLSQYAPNDNHKPLWPAVMSTSYDTAQTYRLGECTRIKFKTYSSWASSGSVGPFYVEGYGALPQECHATNESECTIELCGRNALVIHAMTNDYWGFTIEADDVGDLLYFETVPDGKHYSFPIVLDKDQFDDLHIYELYPNPVKCADVKIKSYSAWTTAGSPGPFFIDGYGELKRDCHVNPDSECTIQVCNVDTLVIRAQTETYWAFQLSGDVGRLLNYEVAPGGEHIEPPYPYVLDTDQYDTMLEFELKLSEPPVEDFDEDCYLPENGSAPPAGACDKYFGYLESLLDGLPNAFGDFFDEAILPGAVKFVEKSMRESGLTVSFDYNKAKTILFFYVSGVPLRMEDMEGIYDAIENRRNLHDLQDQDNEERIIWLHPEGNEPSLNQSMTDIALKRKASSERHLVTDDDLTPECIEVIIRIGVELVALLLTSLGIRTRVINYMKDYMVAIRSKFAPMMIEGFIQSKGQFTARFWAGVVVSFFAKLTWDDIKEMFKTLDRSDWFSLASGFLVAIAGVMSTSGYALVLLVSSLLLTLRRLIKDVQLLGTCFLKCGDNWNVIAGSEQLVSKVITLDSSEGEIKLSYSIPLDIPTQVWFLYEGKVIFQTPGNTVGGNTEYRRINGEEKAITVKLNTPAGLGLSSRFFSVGCPVEADVLCGQSFEQSGFQTSVIDYVVQLDSSIGDVRLYYNMFDVPDRLDLIYEDTFIFSTGQLVSGENTIVRTINGRSKSIKVRVRAPRPNTKWEFRLDCPRNNAP